MGAAAAVEHSNFLKASCYRTVLDAGANKGQFALAVRHNLPDARIVAFEPLAKPSKILRRVFYADPMLTLFPIALGASSGEFDLHISKREDSSSLLPIGRLQQQIFPGTREVGTQRVRVDRLDSIITPKELDRPLLLKIDVQGYELALLTGAEGLLSDVDGIYVELSFVQLYDSQPLAFEIVEWLAKRCFRLEGVYNVTTGPDGTAVQADFFFRRTERS
jgi:FkbM family methyltransferase